MMAPRNYLSRKLSERENFARANPPSPGYRPGEQEAIAAHIARHGVSRIAPSLDLACNGWKPKAQSVAATISAAKKRNATMRENGLREGETFYKRLVELVGPSPRQIVRAEAIKRIALEHGVTREKVNQRIYEYRKSGRCVTFSHGFEAAE